MDSLGGRWLLTAGRGIVRKVSGRMIDVRKVFAHGQIWVVSGLGAPCEEEELTWD